MKFEGYKLIPLREVQLMQLEVMKEIHKVCVKRNIKYYMIAGSVLGAVRHGGFIPWDDDIDIAMMREDYERFKAIFPDEFNTDKYFLQHYDSDIDFKPALMRLCIKNTIRDFESEMHWHDCKNMFLDIFPLDNAPDENALREEQTKKILRLKSILNKKPKSTIYVLRIVTCLIHPRRLLRVCIIGTVRIYIFMIKNIRFFIDFPRDY